MVIRFSIMLISTLLFTSTVFANTNASLFSAELKNRTVELGKPLFLTLKTTLKHPSLKEINLQHLNADFVVEDIKSDFSKQPYTQTIVLKLYPRKTGKINVPVLEFDRHRSKPISVNITPAIDAKYKTRINIQQPSLKKIIWKKEALSVYFDIILESDIVALSQDETLINGMSIKQLPMTSSKIEKNGATRHRLSWQIKPEKSGLSNIQLSAVNLVRDGIQTHRFYPSPISLEVNNLPVYLPDTIPVGDIKISTLYPDNLIFTKGKTYYTTVTVSSDYYSPNFKPMITKFTRSNENIRFYPVEEFITKAPPQHSTSEVAYRIPFSVQKSGFIQPPNFEIKYFEPKSGKLSLATTPEKTLVTLPQWLIYVLYLMLTILSIRLLKYFYAYLSRKYYQYVNIYQALKIISKANSSSELINGLKYMAAAEYWPNNLSIHQKIVRWESLYKDMPKITTHLVDLQKHVYGRYETDIDSIKTALIKLCYARKPVFRYIKI
ncbi:MAG: hypothetical protein OEZ33_02925 [Gammaproteobacteria bacterium]|nr:hypothetical protein [Gammaproteobacteria bacterium]MDH5777140.1 hypothetical protein [Gammaproteobacteria bacterium]